MIKQSLVIFTLALSLSVAWGALTGSEEIEHILASSEAYEIPHDKAVLPWLEQLADTALARIEADARHRNELNIIAGDALHWVGHIHEDRGHFNEAFEAYEKSYERYLATPIRHSVFISNLLTREHAKMHLNKMAAKTGRILPAELRVVREEMHDTGRTVRACLEFYKANIAALRTNTTQPRTCRAIFR